MGDQETPHSQTGITIGKVVAGAGIATGAVLALSAVGLNFGEIGNSINQAFGSLTSGNVSLPSVDWSSPTTQGIAAAGLVGGGFVLNSVMNQRQEELNEARESAVVAGGFAEREQMRAMQGMMKARLSMVDPSHFQGGPAMG